MSATTPKAGASAPKQEPIDEEDGGAPMSFWEHLDELRKRLTVCMIALLVGAFGSFAYAPKLLNLMTVPFQTAWKAQGLAGDGTMHFSSPGGGVIAYIKLSMVAGLAFAAPIIFYQLWSFVAPGLYAREKKFVIPFVLLSTLLFVGGGLFAYTTAFPLTFNYFLSLSGPLGEGGITITPTVMMGEYIDFSLQLILAFGVVFELPLFLLFLSVAGIVNYLQLIRFARWFVLLSFVIAAVFTPPDMTSQIIMAVPMIGLYIISIGLAYIFGKPPTPEQREAYRRAKERDKKTG
ncbi:MAG: twin-arginine translocase subunit TatC [Polyangiaceae bacterium]|nr:twin-arginine translocase subunit TatC [Polyangiaceae bacterium]